MDKSIFNRAFGKKQWRAYINCLLVMMLVFWVLFKTGVIRLNVEPEPQANNFDIYLRNYDVNTLSDSKEDQEIKYGHQLFINTPYYIGPDNGNEAMIFSGNNLACNNCHLYAGTKAYGGPLIGIVKRFPQYRGREDKMGTIEERINGCMERSMNGKVIPENGKEMKALISYLNWLGRYAPKDGKISGSGFLELRIPNRAVNLENGEHIFNTKCVSCHTKEGTGVKKSDSVGYVYPPLWGNGSFNNGAGMNRVITAAQFIKGNMPFGTTFEEPVLTDEEAYDVAGYINQKQRPQKKDLEKDFPDLTKKPVSTPYPPYADTFSVEQHQLGPFQPIMEYYKETYGMNKTK